MAEENDILYDPAHDYYRVLGVDSTATADEIRQVYRQLAKEVHPDRNPNRKTWASQQFKQINEANAVLTDPDLRAEYDRQRYFYLFDAFNAPTPAPQPKTRPQQRRQSTSSYHPRRKMNLLTLILILSGGCLSLMARMSFSNTSYPSYGSYPGVNGYPTLDLDQFVAALQSTGQAPGYGGPSYLNDDPTLSAILTGTSPIYAPATLYPLPTSYPLLDDPTLSAILTGVAPAYVPPTSYVLPTVIFDTPTPILLSARSAHCTDDTVMIDKSSYDTVNGLLHVQGTAAGSDFDSYSLLLYRPDHVGARPTSDADWTVLVDHRKVPVYREDLLVADKAAATRYISGAYTLRLKVWLKSGASKICDVDQFRN